MKKIFQISLFVLLIVFTACKNDIVFNGSEQQEMLVLNSMLSPDSVVKVHLTRSKFFLAEGNRFDTITNANVNLYVNDVWKEQLHYTGDGAFSGAYLPKANDVLRITATSAGLEPVQSVVKMVNAPDLLLLDTVFKNTEISPLLQYNFDPLTGKSIIDTVGKNYHRNLDYRIRFTDNPLTKNFYRIAFMFKTTFTNGEFAQTGLIVDIDDMVFNDHKQRDPLDDHYQLLPFLEFSDVLINGKTYEIKSKFSYYYSVLNPEISKVPSKKAKSFLIIDKQEVTVELHEISESMYLYLRSKTAESQNGGYFAEPVQIYTNIENGIGILGAYNKQAKTFVLPKGVTYGDNFYGGYGTW